MPPRSAGRARPRRPLALVVAAMFLTVACGRLTITPEPATPTNFPGIAGRLNTAGVTVRDWVSGDAGCSDPDLVPTAISFNASGLDQATPVKLYLYIFGDRASFERHRAQIGPCAAAFVTDPQTFQEIEQSPFIVAGQGPWPARFEAALRATLQDAAGTGG